MTPTSFAIVYIHTHIEVQNPDPEEDLFSLQVTTALYRNGERFPHENEHELLVACLGREVLKVEVYRCTLAEGAVVPTTLAGFGKELDLLELWEPKDEAGYTLTPFDHALLWSLAREHGGSWRNWLLKTWGDGVVSADLPLEIRETLRRLRVLWGPKGLEKYQIQEPQHCRSPLCCGSLDVEGACECQCDACIVAQGYLLGEEEE